MTTVVGVVMIASGVLIILVVGYVITLLISNERIMKAHESKLLEVQKSEQRYKALFENSLAGMMKFNPKTREVIDANESMFSIFACTGLSSLQTALSSIPTDVYRKIQTSLIGDGKVGELVIPLAPNRGHEQWILFSARMGHEEDLAHAVIIDITEKKRLEEAYIRAHKMETISLLTSSLAHDLQNILAPVQLSVGLLNKRIKDVKGRKILKATEESANNGLLLIKNILSIGKGVKIEQRKVKLDHTIATVLESIRRDKRKSVSVVSSIRDSDVTVLGDESQLKQVFLNLLYNARDAMPDGGRITVTAKKITDARLRTIGFANGHSRYVCIAVADTGGGIPEENIEKIFDPFFTTKDAALGTGLGLSIVQGIVKNHDGHITVKSKIHRGTVFSVYLPIAEEH